MSALPPFTMSGPGRGTYEDVDVEVACARIS